MIKILNSKNIPLEEILKRDENKIDVSAVVKEIVENVKNGGDKALFEYEEKFDKAKLSALEVSEEEIEEAFSAVDEKFIKILEEAKENIFKFHEKQKRESFVITDKPGVVLGQRVIPLSTVGLYVPGGTASYPSSVLMNVIPAKIAGCNEIIMATPPGANGKINPVILAAAKIAGCGRIFKMGGAQAISAMAYGTETIPKADKIVGPGNAYVAEAKRQVFGACDIDMIAGPSEILVIADEGAKPEVLAADLLSQAEHDKMATAVLITTSKEIAERVATEIDIQLSELPRKEIAESSVENNGKIIITETVEEAIKISNELAPEHLELCLKNPFDYLGAVKNAGSVFLGYNCPEALGDYFAGPNHTLPTSGTAKFSSPLSVDDFVKKSAFTYYTESALKEVCEKVAYFAEKEGLKAHALSPLKRFEK